jgi:hypothetical protein
VIGVDFQTAIVYFKLNKQLAYHSTNLGKEVPVGMTDPDESREML